MSFKFKKILIANRGEIACRIIKTARQMNIRCVAIASDIDKDSRHTREADEVVLIGGKTPSESYLDIDKIIRAASDTQADAIHPGYGFLSENAGFARICEEAGFVFIGPSPEVIETMGLKDKARQIMQKAGVPVVPEATGHNLLEAARAIGFPVLVKAAAGGGGKGMRKVEHPENLLDDIEACQREASAAFGNNTVFIEKYIPDARHIEVQVFGDDSGNVVHLFERDCSIQRRHQKIIEEAPAPRLPDKLRNKIHEAAVTAASALKYRNAGTIEFILDSSGKINEDTPFYFMEMNTRLQVEHPVTEAVTGFDLVEWQIRIAAGESLPYAQRDIKCSGHAFEVRLYAEDPAKDFAPQTGRIKKFIETGSPDYRLDTGFDVGDEISSFYDPMLAKLIVHGTGRSESITKMQEALSNILIDGIVTNQACLSRIFKSKPLREGDFNTHFLTENPEILLQDENETLIGDRFAATAFFNLKGPVKNHLGDNWRLNSKFQTTLQLEINDFPAKLDIEGFDNEYVIKHNAQFYKVRYESFDKNRLNFTMDGTRYSRLYCHGDIGIIVNFDGESAVITPQNLKNQQDADLAGDKIISPMPGRITEILASDGDQVKKGQPVVRMEAMKIETTLTAGKSGVLKGLISKVDDTVSDGEIIAEIHECKVSS